MAETEPDSVEFRLNDAVDICNMDGLKTFFGEFVNFSDFF